MNSLDEMLIRIIEHNFPFVAVDDFFNTWSPLITTCAAGHQMGYALIITWVDNVLCSVPVRNRMLINKRLLSLAPFEGSYWRSLLVVSGLVRA